MPNGSDRLLKFGTVLSLGLNFQVHWLCRLPRVTRSFWTLYSECCAFSLASMPAKRSAASGILGQNQSCPVSVYAPSTSRSEPCANLVALCADTWLAALTFALVPELSSTGANAVVKTLQLRKWHTCIKIMLMIARPNIRTAVGKNGALVGEQSTWSGYVSVAAEFLVMIIKHILLCMPICD